MIGFVFLSLLVMTTVVGVTGVLMFLDGAFSGPEYGLQSAPALCGRRLDRLMGPFDGAGFALRVEQAVSRAVTGLGLKPKAAAKCDASCHEREIQVTTPEALAIVKELRDRQSPAQVEAIRRQAQLNLLTLDGTHCCPLLLSGGFCACEMARPVSCRTHCLAGGDSPDIAERLAKSVETGLTDIFHECLHASGLDDSRYELNAALVQVLNTPGAAGRWARGERILHSATGGDA